MSDKLNAEGTIRAIYDGVEYDPKLVPDYAIQFVVASFEQNAADLKKDFIKTEERRMYTPLSPALAGMAEETIENVEAMDDMAFLYETYPGLRALIKEGVGRGLLDREMLKQVEIYED